MRNKKTLILIFLCIQIYVAQAQYVTNGSAVSNTCNCYTLTPTANGQSGSVWNINRINLTQPFDFKFDVFLGCKDPDGADGIAFILQPINTSVGSQGGGLGYQGITPSIGVLLDTYQNTQDGDPTYDHISINTNGNLNHSGSNNIAGPIQIINNVDNAEDCAWHTLRITWAPNSNTFTAYIDGVQRVQSNIDILNNIFSGNPLVFWGFTGSTGGLNNLQQFCTKLSTAVVNTAAKDTVCGAPASFSLNGSVESFLPVSNYYWNMGDGTTYASQNINHTFTTPGVYKVKFAATSSDGCTSDTAIRFITIAVDPIVTATAVNACENLPIQLTANITNGTSAGQIANINWQINGVTLPNSNSLTASANGVSSGANVATLQVQSIYGCSSTVVATNFTVYPKPSVPTIMANDGCVNTVTTISSSATMVGSQYFWLINGTSYPNTQSITVNLPIGSHIIKHVVTNSEGCQSDTATKTIIIAAKANAQFNVANNCGAQTLTINGINNIAGANHQWLINGVLTASTETITNSFATGNYNITHITSFASGLCSDTITKSFTVYKKPDVNASAATVCEGQSSVFNTTIVNAPLTNPSYFWKFNDGSTSTIINPIKSFSKGNYQAKLVVTNDNICASDTINILFVVIKPFVFAGNDTIVMRNQPFQLNAAAETGIYSWQPANLLNNATLLQPTAIIGNNQQFTLTLTTAQCSVTDTVNVTVFDGVRILVPTAFTPNNDGKNDILKPGYYGIKEVKYFNIYNRWGQKVYSTNQLQNGWNGNLNGKRQSAGTYIWQTEVVDLFGKTHYLKGITNLLL